VELFDTHSHLVAPAFASDLDRVLERARHAGLVGTICVGYDLESSAAAVRLAREHDTVWAAVGVHPHDAAKVRTGLDAGLRDLARHSRVVAIGETGLDYYRDLSPREVQRRVLRTHLSVALELGLPVIIHDREAHADTLAILREFFGGGPRPEGGRPAGVMHCFSGDTALAQACVDLGFYVSFAGPVTYPGADRLRAVASAVPADRLLIETDCPYLAPQSHRGQRNEPSYVAEVARGLAAVRRMDPSDLARLTTENARRLFRLGGDT